MHSNIKKISPSNFEVVDLFCGVGGLSQGFVQEKFKVKAGIDFDDSCAYAFEKNNNAKFLHKDLKEFDSEELRNLYSKKKLKILVGCAPCQPFSIYNRKSSNCENRPEDKWGLLYSFSNLINEVQPEIVSMENVPLLLKFNEGKVFNDFIKNLEEHNYHVTYEIVNAQDYGVAQRRKRLILLASKLGPISILPPTHNKNSYKTLRETIGHLPAIEDGVASKNDPLHFAKKLSPINKLRIRATKEGGSWKDWDESLKLECHKKESGKQFGSVYGRMKWNDVSPTLTTYCIGISNGRFGHPEQNRAISLREAALIQSFPEDYDFIDPKIDFSPAKIARQIGNAVPVGLGKIIAKSIKKHLKTIESN